MAVLAGVAFVGALVALVIVALRYRAAQREGARVRALFSRYLSPPIVDELLRRKDPRLYTGRSLRATILVCRIWNFAGFTEELSPQETLRYLNEFFALAGTSIQKYRGMIDKFLSDGIIGVFGVPLEDSAADEHALRAALDIVSLVAAMNKRWRTQGRRAFQVGIGINTGDVIAGDAGFHERREFTVVGPETLFAERLQAATFELNAFVIAAASTCAAVQARFTLIPLTGHPLPGLKRLADAFIVVGLAKETQLLAMPAEDAFRETTVEAAMPAPAPQRPPPKARMTPLTRISPAPPDIPSMPLIELTDPLAPMKPRRRTAEEPGDTPFAMPQFGIARPHVADDNDRAIVPDLPAPRGVSGYRSGPPIELPP